MDDIRWILLIFGFLFIAGIYLYDSWIKSNKDGLTNDEKRIEPSLKKSSSLDKYPKNYSKEKDSFTSEYKDKEKKFEVTLRNKSNFQSGFIVTIRLVAIDNSFYNGDILVDALEKHGLRIDKSGVFHFHKNETEEITFSAASLIEPGVFNIDKISNQQIPGISFFMSLPLSVDEIEAFDEMVLVIKKISISLKGELLDENGSSLSIQRERYIREQVIEYLLQNNRINSR